ncbi:MAG: MFS transporter [Alphaproteobacteria bacterium]|nr:MFS transporter [Alphaproteobacteria bacterium]
MSDRWIRKGLKERQLAAAALGEVIGNGKQCDEALELSRADTSLPARDRAFVQAIVMTSLRHRGIIDRVLSDFLARPLPAKAQQARWLLMTATAQLLFMDAPAYAVIDLSVEAARADRKSQHLAGLVNAVLRRVASDGKARLDSLDPARDNLPPWLWQRWCLIYGEAAARQIVLAHAREPATDLSVKADPEDWARRLGGSLLPTGTIRLPSGHGPIADLPGFAEGAWWVQDVAAALPVRLFGDVRGKRVLDLCAAPGGKTMQLAAAGGQVTAVDRSAQRLQRLRDNLSRLSLAAEVVTGAAEESGNLGAFDGVILDAPCSATGTVRRHPELPYQRTESSIGVLAGRQKIMLDAAAARVKPGGLLVYCTCSLEPEEGEGQIERFLDHHDDFQLQPIAPGEGGMPDIFISETGYLRTLPFMACGTAETMDGFFAARLLRTG